MERPSTGKPLRQRGPAAPRRAVTARDTPTEASSHTAGERPSLAFLVGWFLVRKVRFALAFSTLLESDANLWKCKQLKSSN